eukprot:TRINITY_DN54212_c0_g1_i1.p2 TRINITY_DN54212_c0_g1~~TRINITY_DN54212_c0_g1_i1.p2  ORF type:complete len:107 (-),score=18.18 TRINITY_DN54212_c0_g1_i1:36-356(-)
MRRSNLLAVYALVSLVAWPKDALVDAESLWDGETKEFWDLCKECTNSGNVFCFTTGKCLDLTIDAPSDVLWDACMNPLLIPDSCRTKGIHPPGTSREEMENWDRDL